MEKNTVWVKNQLNTIEDFEALDKFIEENKSVFSPEKAPNYYLDRIAEHGLTDTMLKKITQSIKINEKPIIDRSNLTNYLNQNPIGPNKKAKELSRDTLIILAILGDLTREETDYFLKLSNSRQLYEKDTRDTCIIFGFSHKSQFTNAIDFYYHVENILSDNKQRPLSSKLTPPAVAVVAYHPTSKNEEATVDMKRRMEEVHTEEELYAFLVEYDGTIYQAETERTNKVLDLFEKYCLQKGLTISDLAHQCCKADIMNDDAAILHVFNLSKKSSIRKGFTRNSIIAFSLVAGFSLAKINTLLKNNMCTELYLRNDRDFYIAFCIETHKTYSETEAQLARQGYLPLSKYYADNFLG